MAARFRELHCRRASGRAIQRWQGLAGTSELEARNVATLGRPGRAGAGARVPTATHAGFLAFWAGLGDERLAGLLEAWQAGARLGVPSVRPTDPRFDSRRYWRGPVWLVVNYMLSEGLREAGFADPAARIARDSRERVETAGFYEYFDPLDGRGLGGASFTWTAAMWLAWLREAT